MTRACPPVLMIVFNRPDLTEQVFNAVRLIRPQRLFIAADGPRPTHPGDAGLCAATRTLLRVDWECNVTYKLEERNLGCGPAVVGAIDWVFEHVDRAIILEDDCLPDPSFFPFCDELLERHADDMRVMAVSGSNLAAPSDSYLGYSYAFSSFSPVWGWATWRRAWARYDIRMPTWPEFRARGMVRGLATGRALRANLIRQWDRAHRGEGTWDHQWWYTVYSEHGLAASPAVNLVTNLGFRPDATQTVLAGGLAAIPVRPMAFPLRHPPLVAENPHVGRHFERTLTEHTGRAVEAFRSVLPSHRLRRRLKRLVRR